MKNFIVVSSTVLISLLMFSVTEQAPDNYYWEGDTRHFFEIDSSLVLIETNALKKQDLSLLEDRYDLTSYRIKNERSVQLITTKKTDLLKAFSKDDIVLISPAIHIPGTNETSFITDEISVKFNQEPDLKFFIEKYDLELIEKTEYGAYLFSVRDAKKTLRTANTIKEKENVSWSNPNFVNLIYLHQVNDPLYPNQYYLNNTGQGGGTANIDINAPEAWNLTAGCDDIRVAVLDDGVDNHEDFNGRVLPGFTAGTNNTGGAPLNHCSKGHGVCCAGIIAATHNGIGVRGVAPNSLIIPVNIFPNHPTALNLSGAASNAEIATAINWAWRPDRGNADVLSNSWGGGLPNTDITSQINLARTSGRGGLGAIVIFSSGNDVANPTVKYPGNVNGVITVGAINRNGNIWNYSCRGPQMDLVAPSGGLGSINPTTFCITVNGDVATTDRMGANGYEAGNYTDGFGGTSAACPQVSGAAALMLSINPNLTETQVRTILQQTATDMGTAGFDNTYGYGRLNIRAALQNVIGGMRIVGRQIICNSETFRINNLPDDATVTWTSTWNSPPYPQLVQNTPHVNECTINNTYSYPSTTTLTATITGWCGQPIVLTLPIMSETNTMVQYGTYYQQACYFYNVYHPSQSGSLPTIPGTPVFLHQGCMTEVTLNQMLSKTVTSTGAEPLYWYYQSGTNKLFLQLPYGSGGIPFTFRITGDGACQEKTILFFSYSNNTRYTFAVAPNPVVDVLFIYGNPNDELVTQKGLEVSKADLEYEINIFDINTSALMFNQKSIKGSLQKEINVSKLRSGLYALKIIEGDEIHSLKFVKE